MKNITLAMFVAASLFMTGCASKNNKVCGTTHDLEKNIQNNVSMENGRKAYQVKVKPIVGSRLDDSKVVVDMGKIQKIWIAPYKYKGTMFASRDIYTWVEKPDFIVGEPVPTNMNRTGMITPLDSLPFAFQSKELATKKTPLTSEDVKHFVNNVYQAQNNPEMLEYKNEQADSKFDSVISDYLNSSDGKE